MHGFILSQQRTDSPQGLVLDYWLSTDNGPQCLHFEEQSCVCFCLASEAQYLPNWPELSQQNSHLKHFNQQPVATLYCKNYQTLLRLKQYCQVRRMTLWEADIKPQERFLMERHIKGSLEVHIQGLHSGTALINPKIKPSQYRPNLTVLSVDIETSMPSPTEPEHLFSIGFYGQRPCGQAEGDIHSQVFMLNDSQQSWPSHAQLTLCPDIPSLLTAASDWLSAFDPDVLIGWNVVNFDFRVLERIYRLHKVPFNWGRNRQKIRLRQGNNKQHYLDIPGRVVVDGIDALRSASYHFESFSLQFVSEALLGRGKNLEPQDIDHRGQAISDLFKNDKIALANYNLNDCKLVLEIFEHTQILEFLINRSQLTGHTLDRMGGSVAAFEYLYLPKLHRAGYIAPNLEEGFDGFKAPGGLVMDSQPGFYSDVLVLDFKSLYPSIIRTFKVDPMGLIEGLMAEPAQQIEGFHDAKFHRDRHFLPAIIEDLWCARDVAKAQQDASASQAIKIIMNSFYGVLGSTGCRFFDARLASSITERGHEIIRTTAQWIERQGYRVIYGDTDSVFVHLITPHTPAQAQQVGDDLEKKLNKFWQQTINDKFQLPSHLEIEFENHYQKFLMPTIRNSELGSKKRYAGLTCDSKMVFKGLEAVRSDWTLLAKDVQVELYKRIFNGKPYESYLKTIYQQLISGKLDTKLIYRKRIRRTLDDYQKNVPPQIQAARKADAFYLANGKMSRYDRGGWIEYVITMQGPEPLEHIQHPLDYQHYLDKQLTPVVDGILYFLGKRFNQLVHPQPDIFD